MEIKSVNKMLVILNGIQPIVSATMRYRIMTVKKWRIVCWDSFKFLFSKYKGLTVKNQPQRTEPMEFFKNNGPSIILKSPKRIFKFVNRTAIKLPKKIPIKLRIINVFILLSSYSILELL
jgi:hypothetical protein